MLQHGSLVFGRLLRRQRSAARLTQEALAERSGISVDAISALENGRRRRPHPDTVSMLARGLGLDVAEREQFAIVARGSRPLQASPAPLVPRELPLRPACFVGRQRELMMLGEESIVAIDGAAGVGKSALAIHAAHLFTDLGAVPDGQLYVDLAASPQPGPMDVLGRMLRSLGLPPSEIPGDLDEAAARFRSLVAGRRLLVLLDNVSDVEQVEPLIPGSASCRVIVTSREVLATLAGARLIHLDVLGHEHALELLGRIVGWRRVLAESEAAGAIVRWCGYLPLAIRVAGARLAARPSWPIGEMARQLSLQLPQHGHRAPVRVRLST